MKKLFKVASMVLLAVLSIAALVGCQQAESGGPDYTVSKKAFADLELTASMATAEQIVSGTEKTIPGSFKYKELPANVTLSYDIPKETVQNVDRYTRLFKVTGPAGAKAYMLITDKWTEDTENWTMWNVLGNITFPAFQYDEMVGGSGSPETMKTFLAGKQVAYQGYWGDASAGNSYETNKQENGNLKADLEFHFGADTAGDYTVTLDIVNLANGTILASVVKTIRVN